MTIDRREFVCGAAAFAAGAQYADAAGTWVWDYEHSHFCFRVFDGEEDYWLDPWLFLREGAPG